MFVRPREGELLSSWIFRTSFEHQIKLQTFCKIFLDNVNIWNRDIDRSASIDLLRLMAARSDTKLNRAYNTTLGSYEGFLFESHNKAGNTKFILPLGIYHRKRKRYSQMYCPSCLTSDENKPYYRKLWRLSFSFVCTKCRCYLRDRCINCGEPVIFFRQELGRKSELPKYNIAQCYSCHNNLGNQPTYIASIKDYNLQKRLEEILGNGYANNISYSHLFFNVLYKLLGILISKRRTLKGFRNEVLKEIYYDPLEAMPQKDCKFELLPLQHRKPIVIAAGWLLEDWPNRFLNIVRKSKTAMSYLTSDMDQIPYWYYQVVSNYSSMKSSAFHNHGSK